MAITLASRQSVRVVDDDLLNRALLIWTGWSEIGVPNVDEQRLVDALGEEESLDLLPRLQALYEDFFTSNAHLTAPALPEMADEALRQFRERHPEISLEAAERLANIYAFAYK
jgi:hypothetical protein